MRKVDDPGLYYKGLWGSRRLVHTVLDCPKPTIAKLHGASITLEEDIDGVGNTFSVTFPASASSPGGSG